MQLITAQAPAAGLTTPAILAATQPQGVTTQL